MDVDVIDRANSDLMDALDEIQNICEHTLKVVEKYCNESDNKHFLLDSQQTLNLQNRALVKSMNGFDTVISKSSNAKLKCGVIREKIKQILREKQDG